MFYIASPNLQRKHQVYNHLIDIIIDCKTDINIIAHISDLEEERPTQNGFKYLKMILTLFYLCPTFVDIL